MHLLRIEHIADRRARIIIPWTSALGCNHYVLLGFGVRVDGRVGREARPGAYGTSPVHVTKGNTAATSYARDCA